MVEDVVLVLINGLGGVVVVPENVQEKALRVEKGVFTDRSRRARSAGVGIGLGPRHINRIYHLATKDACDISRDDLLPS